MPQPGAWAEQTPPLDMLPSYMIALFLSNDRVSEMNNSSFSGLDLLERTLRPCLSGNDLCFSVTSSFTCYNLTYREHESLEQVRLLTG